MEEDWEPFELVEEDGRTILRLHGTEEQRAKVEADKVHLIMDAIAEGWDLDIQYADIKGDLDIIRENPCLILHEFIIPTYPPPLPLACEG